MPDDEIDLADVFGHGPSAPGWVEPSKQTLADKRALELARGAEVSRRNGNTAPTAIEIDMGARRVQLLNLWFRQGDIVELNTDVHSKVKKYALRADQSIVFEQPKNDPWPSVELIATMALAIQARGGGT